MTVVIVTHNMQQAARVSDRTAFMLIGRARRDGADARDVHDAHRSAHGSLHHGTVRMSDAVQLAPPDRPPSQGRASTSSDFSFWYGKKQALFDIDLAIAAARRHGAHRARPAAASPRFLRSINRLNELIPGARRDGEHPARRRGHLSTGAWTSSRCGSASGMVFQRWNPFPKSIYDNVAYGPRINARSAAPRAGRDRRVGAAPRGAVGRGEGPAPRAARSRSPAASSSGSASRARSRTTRRCCCSTSRRRALDPIATQKVEELVYELKRELTIVIVTHNLQQAARISDRTAFFYLGQLVEIGRHAAALHEPARGAHRGLHHREIRMSPTDTTGSAIFTTSSRRSTAGCSTCRSRRRRSSSCRSTRCSRRTRGRRRR